jgi:hypothetical protein
MGGWDVLTPEQYAIMINAEEAYLVNVMDEWRARVRWAETGTTRIPSDLTDGQKIELKPRFAHAVTDLVSRGWLTVHEFDTRLADQALHNALADPDSWLQTTTGRHCMIEIVTTDMWRELLRADLP